MSGSAGRLAAALRMRLCRRATGGGCRRRRSRPSTPAAQGDVTTLENVVRDGLLGGPAPDAADGVGGLPCMGPGGGLAAPKGMPSEASLELCFREFPEEG